MGFHLDTNQTDFAWQYPPLLNASSCSSTNFLTVRKRGVYAKPFKGKAIDLESHVTAHQCRARSLFRFTSQ